MDVVPLPYPNMSGDMSSVKLSVFQGFLSRNIRLSRHLFVPYPSPVRKNKLNVWKPLFFVFMCSRFTCFIWSLFLNIEILQFSRIFL